MSATSWDGVWRRSPTRPRVSRRRRFHGGFGLADHAVLGPLDSRGRSIVRQVCNDILSVRAVRCRRSSRARSQMMQRRRELSLSHLGQGPRRGTGRYPIPHGARGRSGKTKAGRSRVGCGSAKPERQCQAFAGCSPAEGGAGNTRGTVPAEADLAVFLSRLIYVATLPYAVSPRAELSRAAGVVCSISLYGPSLLVHSPFGSCLAACVGTSLASTYKAIFSYPSSSDPSR